MRFTFKSLIYLVLLVAIFNCRSKKDKYPELTNADITDVIGRMTELMIHDVTNPPLAARFFSYACLSGYEIISRNDTSFHSMHGVVKDYPGLTVPDSIRGYSYQLAAVFAMLETAKKMQPSGKQLESLPGIFYRLLSQHRV